MQKGEQTTAYTYDGMGRLLTETEGDAVTAYSYTPFGNRATKAVTADGVTTQTVTYAYDKNNRLTKEQSTQDGQTVVTGYTYDHNGNQIIKNAMVLSSEGGARSFALGENNNSTEFFTYDLRNRLTQYKTGDTKASYTYGADGFRNAKTVNGVTTSFIYDGANIVETKQGETVTDYIRGIGLIKYTDGTTTAYYFTDDHGSTSSLYNATGTKIADYTYDAFGNEAQVSSTDTNPFRYCGEYTDQESGLVYLRARYYDPQTGRFISEDNYWNPSNMIYGADGMLLISAIMQSSNLYVYALNNPLRYHDPNGNNIGDILFGITQALDENNFGGAVGWVANKFGRGSRDIDLEYDYYLGRVIGDALSALYGAGVSASGICEIIGSIVVGGTVTVGSGGTLAIGGVSISVAGAAAGAASVTYGSTVVMMSAGNFGSDVGKMQQAGMNNKRVMHETKIKGYKVSMDLEKGGSGQNNIHLKVDGKKYIFNADKEAFLDSAGRRLPKSLRGDQEIIDALGKAIKLNNQGW